MDEDKKEELRDDSTEQREADDSGGDSGDSNGIWKCFTCLSDLTSVAVVLLLFTPW